MAATRTEHGTHGSYGIKGGYLPVFVTLVIGTVVALMLFFLARGWEWDVVEKDFKRTAQDRHRLIQKQLDELVKGTHGLRAFYAGADSVTEDMFEEFVREEEYTDLNRADGSDVLWTDGVMIVGWLPMVEKDTHNRGERASARTISFPIQYMVPRDNEFYEIGQDLYAEQFYYDPMRQAQGGLETYVTGRIPIGRDRYAVAFFTPVNETRTGFESFLSSGRELMGLTLCLVDVREFMEKTFGFHPDSSDQGIHTVLLDAAALAGEQRLFSRPARDEDGEVTERLGDLSISETFDIGGRRLTMMDTAAPSFVAARRTGQPWILLFISMLATLVVARFLQVSVKRNLRVSSLADELQESHSHLEQRVEEATAELQKSHDQMELRVKEATAELQEAYDGMEQKVEERTAEARRAAEEAETARAEIAAQAELMMEMSTPVIKLWRGIVLTPLIGVLDTARSTQMTERVLSAIVENEAKVVILDVTGVAVIDTSVARHIISTVNAARILGADVVITGFSPEAAQTLSQLGVDFATLKTRGSLSAGLRDAMRSAGIHLEV